MDGLGMKVKCKARREKVLMGGISPAGGEGAFPGNAGAELELELEKRGGGQDILKVEVVHITPAGNAPSQKSKFQRCAAEGIRIEGELVYARGAQLPIRLFAVVVHGNGFDGGVVVRPEAEIQRQAVESGEPLYVRGDQFFVGEIF